jgi:hypothetical protein
MLTLRKGVIKMKKTCIAIALLLIFSFCATCALADNTTPEIHSLQITSVSLKKASNSISWDVKLKNVSDKSIDSFTLQYRFFDKYGKRLFEYENTVDGYQSEVRFLTYTPKSPIKSKKTCTASEQAAMYLNAGKMEVAVSSFMTSDGVLIYLKEDQRIWHGSDKTVSSMPPDTATHKDPSEEDIARGNTFSIGISYISLLEEDAKYYLHEHGGLWIIGVNAGSLAEIAGLLPGDVLVAIDSKPLSDDTMYEFNLGKTRMADGKNATIEFERNGIIYSCILSKYPQNVSPAVIKSNPEIDV